MNVLDKLQEIKNDNELNKKDIMISSFVTGNIWAVHNVDYLLSIANKRHWGERNVLDIRIGKSYVILRAK